MYEFPATAFVANFLGQSNLLAGDGRRPRRRRPGASTAHGAASRCPSGRARGTDRRGLVGRAPGEAAPGRRRGRRCRPGTSASRASSPTPRYIGVSTQYLLRTGWGEELTRLRAEHRRRRPLAAGRAGRPCTGTRARVPARRRPRTADDAERRADAVDAASTGRAHRVSALAHAGRGRSPRRPPPRSRCRGAPPAAAVPAAAARRAVAGRSSSCCRRCSSSPPASTTPPARWHRLRDDLGVRQLRGRDADVLAAVPALAAATPASPPVVCAAAGLPAGVRDRAEGRPVEEPAAGLRDRAVLHQLPGPHPGLEDDPVRQRRSSSPAARRAPARPPTAGCWPPRSRWSPA